MAGYDHDYWAYVPESYSDARAHGLLVWIHPAGDSMEAAMLKEWKTICDRRGLILVAPKAEKPAGWQPGEVEFIKSLIESFAEKYTIDNSRILVHSHGSGAPMAWLTGLKHREIVRGVVVTGASFTGAPPESEPDLRQQYLLGCGDNDPILPRVKSAVIELRKLKLPVSLRVYEGLGLKYPAEVAIEEIGRWVDSLDRI